MRGLWALICSGGNRLQKAVLAAIQVQDGFELCSDVHAGDNQRGEHTR